jgi:hypothetical protein
VDGRHLFLFGLIPRWTQHRHRLISGHLNKTSVNSASSMVSLSVNRPFYSELSALVQPKRKEAVTLLEVKDALFRDYLQ